MPLLACPDVLMLRRYLQGVSTETEASSVEGHLSHCRTCQTQVDTLGHGSDSFISDLIRAAAAPDLQYVGGAHITQDDHYSNPTGAGDGRERSSARQPLSGLRQIRDYLIIDCLGQGGMGCVYRAIHQHLKRIVAVKILQSDRAGSPEAILRFSREMKVLANLVHPCIVQAFDGGEHEGMPYFVMELVDGVDLQKLIRNVGPLPVPEACQIIRKAAGALQYAHEQKIIHRDVKPSNLMVTTSGNVKLLDLGLAQIFGAATEDAISRTGQIVGTLSYMAPEQITGGHPVDQRSDIFSLGITFYELLIGRRPYEGMSASFVDLLDARPDVSPELLKLLCEMISLSAPDRPATMAEVEQRLGAICPEVNLMTFVSRYFRGDESRVAPPVQVSGSGRLSSGRASGRSQVEAVLPPSTGRRKRSAIFNRNALVAALGGALLATSGWFAINGNRAEKLPEGEPPPILPALVEFATVRFASDQLALQWMSKKKVIAFNLETKIAYAVVEPEKELPVGSYELRFLSPPVKLQQDGMRFEVLRGDANNIDVAFNISTPFMVPDLPEKIGAFAEYFGTIQWADRDEIAYNLRMTMLFEERESNLLLAKWFKIEAVTKHAAGNFTETAYIKLDVSEWAVGKLVISDGWVEIDSPEINRFRQSRFTNADQKYVVPFSMERDEISELAKTTYLPLPDYRVSMQDYVALFFGDDDSANTNAVASLRTMLGAGPVANPSLQDMFCVDRLRMCYWVSPREKPDDYESRGYTMVRGFNEQDNPFGFVLLNVNVPGFKAMCKLGRAGTLDLDPLQERRELDSRRREMLKQMNEKTPALSPVAGPALPKAPVPAPPVAEPPLPSKSPKGDFDIAWLPDTPHSITYKGTVQRGERNEKVTFSVKLLSYQKFENGGQGAWIEVEVSSLEDNTLHWEAVRLLIDADAYRNSNSFNIKGGWVAFDKPEFVYAFPKNGDLESLVDQRLQLQSQMSVELQTDFVGVIDILYMIFKAELEPTSGISRLRNTLLRAIDSKRTSSAAEHVLTSGETLKCEMWSTQAYNLYRNSNVPFGFVKVKLWHDDIDIVLEIENKGVELQGDSKFRLSKFGTMENIITLSTAHQLQLSKLSRLNWRAWSWKESRAGASYNAWAEYGGTFEVDGKPYLLLRDEAKSEIRIPVNLLTDASRKSMEQGRYWESLGRQLVILDRDTRQVTFQEPKLPNKNIVHNLSVKLSESDSEWFKRLFAAEKRKVTDAQMSNEWKAFAGYVRAK